jgi:hypothetical protein
MVLENSETIFSKKFSKGLGLSQQQKFPDAPTGGEGIFSEQAILFLCLLWNVRNKNEDRCFGNSPKQSEKPIGADEHF